MTGTEIEYFWGDPDPLNGIEEYVQMVRVPEKPKTIGDIARPQPKRYEHPQPPVQPTPIIGPEPEPKKPKSLFNNATNWLLALIAFLLFLIFVENLTRD